MKNGEKNKKERKKGGGKHSREGLRERAIQDEGKRRDKKGPVIREGG